jgi:hypothetical protein
MRKRIALVLPILCLAVIAAYAGWAFYRESGIGGGWGSLIGAWPYLFAAVATVAAVMVLFIRLAFYSDRHGYDQRAGRDRR